MLSRSFEQLVKDGTQNEWKDLNNLGYNKDKVKGELDTTLKQLETYPKAL
jgi:hypothetical protein